MAEEALKRAAKKLDVEIKVETHGQVGVENEITTKEIQEADGVIIAADKDVQADRFIGKPAVDVPVAKAIKGAEQLIQTILDGKGKPYKSASFPAQSVQVQEDATPDSSSFGRQIYKHIMNGVSYMLPFVVGGEY